VRLLFRVGEGGVGLDGAPVVAEFFANNGKAATSAGASIIVSLFESSTQIARLCLLQAPTSDGQGNYPMIGKIRFTPSAASHTYTVTGFQSGGNGAIIAGSGGTGAYSPCYIRFTKA
jgi:hypothetical protein